MSSTSIFTTTWSAPSNIALIKYWGKRGYQLPCNPSLSLSLDQARTKMTVTVDKDDSDLLISKLIFEGRDNDQFKERLRPKLFKLIQHFPLFNGLCFSIESSNTFPHSAGIASSASSMAALALALAELEQLLLHKERVLDENFYVRASEFARLLSGSASRSVYGGLVQWGVDKNGIGHDEYAIILNQKRQANVMDIQDTILVLSSEEKSVSSGLGHRQMNDHPFASARYESAQQHFLSALEAIDENDFSQLGLICEKEAMQLHAMMMTGAHPYFLINDKTLLIIQKLWQYRRDKDADVYFTLDAGANIHLLSRRSQAEQRDLFIQSLDSSWIQKVIYDHVGDGPYKAKEN